MRGCHLLCAAVLLAPAIEECPAVMTGGGDEIDQRIDDAMTGVRRDRPWKLAGSVSAAPRLDSYEPPPAAYRRRGDAWEFAFTPFVWLPSLDGDIGAGGLTTDIDSSIGKTFESIVDNFDFALMGRFEARRCRWLLIADLMLLSLEGDEDFNVAGVGQADLNWDFDQVIAAVYGGYRFSEVPLGCGDRCFTPTATFDALVGIRYYHVGIDLDLDPGPFLDEDNDWVDPVVGGRALFHVAKGLSFNLEANIGGFGVGSDLSWQIVGGAIWHLNDCLSLAAGWMILDIDFDDGDFVYDVTMSGPYLAMTFRF